MAPQWRAFEPELIDSLCHDADELHVKRMTLRGRGQSQSTNTLPRPKLTEKKAVIYFAVTRTERDHVAHGRGMLTVRAISPAERSVSVGFPQA